MLEIDKDRAAIGWLTGAWDDYTAGFFALLPVLLLQAAIASGGLPLINKWHSLLPAAAYSLFVTTPVSLGCVLVYIRMARGGPARLADLFGAFPVYHRVLAVSVGLGLLTLGGLLAFVLPGVLLYLTYCFSEYLVVDRRTGVKESFALSRTLAEGWRRRLLPIAMLMLVLNLFAPEIARVSDPFKNPEVSLDLRPWTVAAYLLKNFVFMPWLGLAMARAYVFLLSFPTAAQEPDPTDA
ncbi:MAG: hypothetical protein A2049_11855 [Elusimicrobia bacterium GWA2_62_23]|nr:MAG: hypothetical protein A2049_11855 [Elusimicrobia bacterium GWA2_62_23]OGR69200.1 MAG: hypothetical protein A2179_06630 [Elusimicrobia bacterium GWC2_63_65]